jgi:hypothetical protein
MWAATVRSSKDLVLELGGERVEREPSIAGSLDWGDNIIGSFPELTQKAVSPGRRGVAHLRIGRGDLLA